jgi:beta-N-acetylhexosaminidase
MREPVAPVLLALLLLSAGCATMPEPAPPPAPGTLAVADLLLVGFRGIQVEGNDELRSLVCDVKVGGVILFERDAATGTPRNIVSPEQVSRLTSDLQALALRCAGRPLLIAVDNEGGAVMRLSTRLGYLPSPSARELGAAGDLALTELEARRMGGTLREAGINWNLAPVVDVAVNPANPVIVAPGRAYSADADRVTAQARAFITGMHAAGILTALKHFPGHGSSRGDSHAGFTDVSDTADPAVELAPYRALIAEGMADSVMTAHVFNRRLDPWDPATLSRFTVNRILRGWLGYRGVVVSDDLLMGAIIQNYGLEEAAVLALAGGVDVLLVSHNTGRIEDRAAQRVVMAVERAMAGGKLSPARVADALTHVDVLRGRIGVRS